jgi:exopolysaccharide production protein ExoQ
MSGSIATLLYAALIITLFWLDSGQRPRAAIARWFPAIFWSLPGSRQAYQSVETQRPGRDTRASPALWIPVVWFFLSASRSASEWFQSAPPGMSAETLVEGDPINRIVYASLVALALLVLAFRAQKILRLLQANILVLIFLLYCALSLSWAEYPDVGFKRWIKLFGDLAMVLIVASERDPSLAIRQLLTRTGFLLIPISMLMIKYYPNLARYYDRWEWETYYSGATTNKNALGVLCLLFGLASTWQLLRALFGPDRTGWVRRLIAHGVILAMVAWLFSLASSMTAISCFCVGLAVLVGVGLRLTGRRPWAALMVEFRPLVRGTFMLNALIALLIAVPTTVLLVGVESILLMLGKNPTLTDRTLIWNLVLSLSPDAWFGTGFENFWLGPRLDTIWSAYSWKPNQAHNGYIETYLNLGLIGVALLVSVLAVGYLTVMSGLRRFPSMGGLMLAYFAMAIVFNITEAAFFRISTPVWFVLLLAITKIPDFPGPKTLRFEASRGVRKHAVPVARNI